MCEINLTGVIPIVGTLALEGGDGPVEGVSDKHHVTHRAAPTCRVHHLLQEVARLEANMSTNSHQFTPNSHPTQQFKPGDCHSHQFTPNSH
jgi:hypothetical protein